MTDGRGCIVDWNRAAELLFGCGAGSVIGKRCYEVVDSHDLFGNRFCSRHCTLSQMVAYREPVRSFQVRVAVAGGRECWTRCSIVVVPGNPSPHRLLVHVLEPLNADPQRLLEQLNKAACGDGAALTEPPSPVTNLAGVLTSRQTEVLRLVASGFSVDEIDRILHLSRATIRNHIQGILRKLGVHSRLQAIRAAQRMGLL